MPRYLLGYYVSKLPYENMAASAPAEDPTATYSSVPKPPPSDHLWFPGQRQFHAIILTNKLQQTPA